MKIPRLGFSLFLLVFSVFLVFSGCNGGDSGPTVNPTSTAMPSPTPTLPVRNITQGTQYATIQGAINAAQSGNEIVVSPGTYHENIDFKGKNITVRSEDPEDPAVVAQTIIDGGWNGSVVTFQSGETNQAVLNGFTLRNGTGKEDVYQHFAGFMTVYLGGGIYIKDSSPSITYNVIKDNGATWGGGIYMEGTSSPRIIRNTIENNQSQGEGGGICVFENSSPLIHQNVIRNNHATGGSSGPVLLPPRGGGICVGSSASVKNIVNASWPKQNCPPAGTQTGGTWVYQNNTFSGNTHLSGESSDGCHVYFE